MSVHETGQDICEVPVWLDVVEFAAFDDGGEDRPRLSALVAAGEQGILPVKGDRPDRPLNGIRDERPVPLRRRPPF